MPRKLVFDMSSTLVSKIEASGGSQNYTLQGSFTAVQFAHESSSRKVLLVTLRHVFLGILIGVIFLISCIMIMYYT